MVLSGWVRRICIEVKLKCYSAQNDLKYLIFLRIVGSYKSKSLSFYPQFLSTDHIIFISAIFEDKSKKKGYIHYNPYKE